MIKSSQRLLPVLIAGVTLSGCASLQGPGSNQELLAEKDQQIAELNAQVSTMQQSLTEEQRARSVQESSAGTNTELLPPNAKPGECYARVFVPPTYKTEEIQVLKSDASERIDVEPERYEWMDEQVLVKGASERLEVVPATYEWVEEQVLVKPAGKEIVAVPAKYRTVTEQVLDKPEHTVWKKGTGPITRIDDATGEIMCLVTVPATYKTISKQVLDQPAGTKEIEIPAEYKTVRHKVMKTPPTTRKIEIPAEYKTVRVRKLVQEARTMRTPIPAEYGTVTKREMVAEGRIEWRPVLCQTNMSADVVRRIQTALRNAGHNPGPIDGVIGHETMAAVKSYQRANGLATGGITMKTLESLGIKI